MTITEGLLTALLVGQSAAWIAIDFRRFCKNFDHWADRSAAPAHNFEDFS
ncbi:hypothetical protein ABZU78_12005 [Rhodococcus erythropolis]